MSARIIDGAAIAQQIKNEVQLRARRFADQGKRVHLTAILVGATPAGELYAQRQAEACRAVGIQYTLLELPADTTQRELKSRIRQLNKDATVTGIMMHLPLPQHIDAPRMQYEI